MFYSSDILTRREGGFGLFWLVSTLGAKGGTSFKKLTRKEVLGADLVKACKRLADPEEPFALRLSSNILSGISRVYQQQYTIYQSDVSTMHQSLKKAFSDAFARSLLAAKSIELPTPNAMTAAAQAGVSGIGGGGVTLAMDPTLAVLGWDIDWDSNTDWEKMLTGGGGGGASVDGEMAWEGDYNFSSGIEEDLQIKKIRRYPTGAHTVHDRASITLQEPHLDDYILHDEHDLILDGDFGGDYDLGEFGDIGLLEGLSPRLDAQIRASSAEAGSRYGRGSSARDRIVLPSSSGIGGAEAEDQDLGGDDFFGDMDFGGGEETLEERVQREHAEGLEQGNITGKAVRGSSEDRMDVDEDVATSAQMRKSDENENDGIETAQLVKRVRKASKVTLLVDRVITLTNDQVSHARTDYDDRMMIQKDKVEKAQGKKLDQARGVALIYGIPDAFAFAPELAALWKTNVSDHLPLPGQYQADARKNFRRNSGDAKPNDDNSPQHGRSGVLTDRFGSKEAEIGMGDGYFDFGDFGGGGKEEENQDLGGYEDYGWGDGEIEQGRGDDSGNLIASQQNADLPWNRPSDADLGGFDILYGDASSQTGTQIGAGRVSLDTPNAVLNRKRSRSGSLLPSLLNSKSPIGGRRGSEIVDERAGNFEGMEIEEINADEVKAIAQESQRALATLERESLNFLAYAKRQALNDTSDFLFSDIVPIASTNEFAAAQALYHLLALASKSLLHVHQSEAYGAIHIELVQGV